MNGIVIKKPVISEKSIHLGTANKYTFTVDPRANAQIIKQAVQELFQVKVKNINIIRVKGKPKRFGRLQVKRDQAKKAIVTLMPGQTIKLFEEKTQDAN